MSAGANVTPDFDGPEDRQLADDIARAMHHRPLLKRLSRVEQLDGGAMDFLANAAPSLAAQPHAAAVETPQPAAELRSIEEVIDDLGQTAAAPPSAQWLENARQAHRQKRVSYALGWLTTLAIAIAIIGVAAVLLRL